MSYTEQQIDQIFQQLGMLPQPKKFGAYTGSGAVEGLYTGKGAYSPTSVSQIPMQYREHLKTDPAALNQTGFWEQFWWGITSPITGTLHKLDPQKFAQFETTEPTNIKGMLGRMAGSIAGWGALFTGLALPMIGAPLTVASTAVASGIVAAGKGIGIGVGAKLASAVATGAVTSALASAHHAWLEDKPIGPEVLKWTAFGGAMGAGGYAASKALHKLRVTQPDALELLKEQLFNKKPLLNAADQADFTTLKWITTATKSKSSAIASDIVRGAPPVKVDIGDDILATLTKTQKASYTKINSATTFGEQVDQLRIFSDSLRKGFDGFKKKHNITSVADLLNSDNKTALEYAKRFETLDDLKRISTEHLRGILTGDVALPPISSIHGTKTSNFLWSEVKRAVKQDPTNINERDFMYHPKLQEVFAKYKTNSGESYQHFGRAVWPKELQNEYDNIVKTIGHAKIYWYGETAFPIPDGVSKANLANWITSQTKAPISPGFSPTTIGEIYSAGRPLGFITKNFFPLRYGIGKTPADVLRRQVTAHQKFVDNRAGAPVLKWINEDLGISKSNTKEARRQGELIQRVLELDYTPETNMLYDQAGNSAIWGMFGATKKVKEETVKTIAKTLELPPNAVKKAMDDAMMRLSQKSGFGKKGNLSFVEFLERLNVTPEQYVGSWLKQQKLYYSAIKPTDAAAKLFGLENAKQLKVAYQMRRAYNNLFEEAGLDAMMYQVGYMPHFKQMDGQNVTKLLANFEKIGTDKKYLEGITWMNALHRTAPDGVYTYETDAFKAFTRYVTGFSKQKHYGETFENLNKYVKEAKYSSNRVDLLRKVEQHLKGVPSEFEVRLDEAVHNFGTALNWKGWNDAWGPKPTREMASVLAELQVMGGLGFNPFTAAKNLTQKMLAFSSITDDGNPMHGMMWFMKAQAFKRTPEGKRWLAFNKIVDNRIMHEGYSAHHSAIGNVFRKMGIPDPLMGAGKSVKEKSMAMFRAADISNVNDTFMAKLMYATSQGTDFTAAVNKAIQTTMATQFMYGFDSPLLYKSTGILGPVGRAVGVFTSWPLNWAHLMVTQGTSGEGQRALASVVTMAIGAEILSLSKFSFNSIHPAETASGILPIAVLESEQNLPMLARTAATALTAFRALKEGDHDTVDQALTNFKQRMWLLVPAGTMAKRTLEVIDLAQNEWRKTDRKGRLSYETNPQEAIRSWFGPTLEAQLRWDDYHKVKQMDYAYRDMRRKAINAFVEGDLEKFQLLQEQLVINFGEWIQPMDIKQELSLREKTARERQLQTLPTTIREPFLNRVETRYLDKLNYAINR